MPDVEHGQSDVESLARKLRRLDPELTVGERRLLERIMAAAAVPGTAPGTTPGPGGMATGPGGMATAVVDSAGSEAHTTGAVEGADTLRAQFADAFTPGAEWSFGGPGDIGMVH